jgi:hypothetical protein
MTDPEHELNAWTEALGPAVGKVDPDGTWHCFECSETHEEIELVVGQLALYHHRQTKHVSRPS